MKGWEALKALEEGKKIRLSTWCKGSYTFERGNMIVHNKSFDFFMDAFLLDDWEIYEEPEEGLKPEGCPLCKKCVELLSSSNEEYQTYLAWIKCWDCELELYIKEYNTDIESVKRKAIKKWNTRAAS